MEPLDISSGERVGQTTIPALMVMGLMGKEDGMLADTDCSNDYGLDHTSCDDFVPWGLILCCCSQMLNGLAKQQRSNIMREISQRKKAVTQYHKRLLGNMTSPKRWNSKLCNEMR
jgi:hypothetical protein